MVHRTGDFQRQPNAEDSCKDNIRNNVRNNIRNNMPTVTSTNRHQRNKNGSNSYYNYVFIKCNKRKAIKCTICSECSGLRWTRYCFTEKLKSCREKTVSTQNTDLGINTLYWFVLKGGGDHYNLLAWLTTPLRRTRAGGDIYTLPIYVPWECF